MRRLPTEPMTVSGCLHCSDPGAAPGQRLIILGVGVWAKACTAAATERMPELRRARFIDYAFYAKLKPCLKSAKLRHNTCVEDIDYRAARGLEKSVIRGLAEDSQWVQNHENLFGLGPTGVGKSFIACALDWAMGSLSEPERRYFWEICEDRYQARSVILTSQLPVTRWHERIGDPTVADGIDRLVHDAHRIEMRGGSMRKNRGKPNT
jgi:DNA replication protein DnaC